jgi:hypothetical protein
VKYLGSLLNNPNEYLMHMKPPVVFVESAPRSKNEISVTLKLRGNPHRQPPPATHARIVEIFLHVFVTKRKSQLGDNDTVVSIAIWSRSALCGYLGCR